MIHLSIVPGVVRSSERNHRPRTASGRKPTLQLVEFWPEASSRALADHLVGAQKKALREYPDAQNGERRGVSLHRPRPRTVRRGTFGAEMIPYQILTFNQITSVGLERFPRARYSVGETADRPDAILVRSHDLHNVAIPASVLAIGRVGAGTNNVPVAEMSRRGTPVFNTPGANANAVKELV